MARETTQAINCRRRRAASLLPRLAYAVQVQAPPPAQHVLPSDKGHVDNGFAPPTHDDESEGDIGDGAPTASSPSHSFDTDGSRPTRAPARVVAGAHRPARQRRTQRSRCAHARTANVHARLRRRSRAWERGRRVRWRGGRAAARDAGAARRVAAGGTSDDGEREKGILACLEAECGHILGAVDEVLEESSGSAFVRGTHSVWLQKC